MWYSRQLSLNIPVVAVPKGRARTKPGQRPYTPAATRAAEEQIQTMWMAAHGRKGLEFWGDGEPVLLVLEVYLERPASNKRPLPTVRPDIDNYQKLCQDALNGIVWKDDSQVTDVESRKRYCVPGESPHVAINVYDAPSRDVERAKRQLQAAVDSGQRIVRVRTTSYRRKGKEGA